MSTTEHGHGHSGEGASEESVKLGFELTDWQARPVLVLTIITFITLAFAFILIAGLILLTGGEIGDTSHQLAPTSELRLPPAPLLEQNPNVDGNRIIGEATERLESYGWVDESQGVAHIPIEEAMEEVLARGVDPFGEGQAGAAEPEPTAAPAAGGPVEFDAALAAQGEQIFTNLGCAACHREDGAGIGPSLVGVYNTGQTLVDGGTALADEAYLIESILNANAKIVEGYQPVMPAYEGQLSENQVAQLVEYIKSLGQ